MGVELDGARLFRSFERGPGTPEDIPYGSGLEWYIDLRFSGPDLPKHPALVADWLLTQSDAIQAAILDFAKHVGAGLDGEFPLESGSYGLGNQNVQLQLVTSVTHRVTQLNFVQVLTEFANEFPNYVHKLSTPEPTRI